MGSGGGLWDPYDSATASRMNQKNIYVGSSEPGSKYQGMVWIDTSTTPYTKKVWNSYSSSWEDIQDIAVNRVKMPSPTSSDYSTPSSATASSEAFTGSPTLDQSYNTGDDDQHSLYGSIWKAQTFTPSVSKCICSVKLKLKVNTNSGTCTVSIRNTSSNLPTGSDLCSASKTGGEIGSSLAWIEFVFTTHPLLTAGTRYAILVRFTGGDLVWRLDGTSPTYTGGAYCHSGNGGSTWTEETGKDFMFEEYYYPTSYAASNTCDDDIGTRWEPYPVNEANAWIYIDAGSNKLISGVRIYFAGGASYNPSAFDIDYSTDASTWTEAKAVTTAPTDNAWNEYSFNTVYARYIRVQINQHGTSGTHIYEIDYYSSTVEKVAGSHGHGAATATVHVEKGVVVEITGEGADKMQWLLGERWLRWRSFAEQSHGVINVLVSGGLPDSPDHPLWRKGYTRQGERRLLMEAVNRSSTTGELVNSLMRYIEALEQWIQGLEG